MTADYWKLGFFEVPAVDGRLNCSIASVTIAIARAHLHTCSEASRRKTGTFATLKTDFKVLSVGYRVTGIITPSAPRPFDI